MLASATVFEALQVGLSFTLSARRHLDRTLETAWAALNLVPYGELEALRRELVEARASAEALEARLLELAGSGDGTGPR